MSPDDSTPETPQDPTIAAVVPCFREKAHVLDVLAAIGPEVAHIFVVDDACPDGTGDFVAESSDDPRVTVLKNPENQGVGGATVTGYRAAIAAGADIIVKLDGDGQMDPTLIPKLVAPIARGRADYAKGNRLHRPGAARGMPWVRLFGNMALTLFCKISSGYWSVTDPNNGFTAIHARVAAELPLHDIARGFFFESDMLFRLGGLDAAVEDVPMRARYGAETSHLSIRRIFWPFLSGHLRNAWRRHVDTYFVRDVGVASLQLVLGTLMLAVGVVFGAVKWWTSVATGEVASAGTVMLAALLVIVGVQLLLAFLAHDTRRQPRTAIHPALPDPAAAPPPRP